jgi:hypothetical protein
VLFVRSSCFFVVPFQSLLPVFIYINHMPYSTVTRPVIQQCCVTDGSHALGCYIAVQCYDIDHMGRAAISLSTPKLLVSVDEYDPECKICEKCRWLCWTVRLVKPLFGFLILVLRRFGRVEVEHGEMCGR